MAVVSTYSTYGWKARIGLIVPSTNTVNEAEFWRMAPDGVSVHTSRLLFRPTGEADALAQIDAHMPRALEELAGAEVDVIAYGCTAGSIHTPPEEVAREIEEATGIAAVTVTGAVLAALEAFGAKSIAIGTPYPPELNEEEKQFFEGRGYRVTATNSVILSEQQMNLRHMNRVPPQSVFRLALDIDTPDTDAIFISCTDLATLDVIEEIEKTLQKPVITSSQATFWQTLRTAGLHDRLSGYGRLLAEH